MVHVPTGELEPVASGHGSGGSKSCWSFLFARIDIAFLVFFRIVFAGAMLGYVGLYAFGRVGGTDAIAYYFIDPPFHFTYLGFGWVRPWPGAGMYVHFAVLGVAAVGVLLGACYRLSAVVCFLAFTGLFLMEKAHYQNHYYLLCLLSLLMVVLPAHRAFSVDALFRPRLRSASVEAWTLWLLRAQIGIPYLYGGLAKLNSDWLAGEPVGTWMAKRAHDPLLGSFFQEQWLVLFFTWGGLLYDLAVVPMLLWRRTRLFAFLLTVGFHSMNAVMWDIGIFPWFMLPATLVFFDPSWPRRLFGSVAGPAPGTAAGPDRLTARQQALVAVWAAYLGIQLIFPFRHLTYPGHPNWTEEGHRFAWHMMLRDKQVAMRFFVTYPDTGETREVDITSYVNHWQLSRLGKDVDMILEFAHFLGDRLEQSSGREVEIRMLSLVSLNRRKPQLLLDPHENLLAHARSWRPHPLILPLTEPLPKEPWDAPITEWEHRLEIESPASRLRRR